MNDTPKNTPENENEIDFNNELDTDVSDPSDSDNTFDIELESLDDFLKGDDDTNTNDTFSLEEEDLISVTDEEKKSGSSVAKIAGYVVLLAMLGGMGYAGVKYIPQLTGADEMSVFEQHMNDRSAAFEQDINTFSQVTQDQAMDVPMHSMAEPAQILPMQVDEFGMPVNEDVQPMPMASDVIPAPADDFIVVDDGFAPVDDVEGADISGFDAPPIQANSISDIVEMTQAAPAPVVPTEPVDTLALDDAGQDTTSDTLPAEPVITLTDEDLPPVPDSQIETVDQVMNQDPAALIAEVEAQSANAVNNATTIVDDTQNIVIEDHVPSAPPAEALAVAPVIEEEVVADKTITSTTAPAPITEPVIDVPEVKAVPPVRTEQPKPKKAAPKPVQVETKPAINAAAQLSKTTDARISEGRAALRAGDFARATQIFDAVLRENPSNVHALTGKQMAISRIRVTETDTVAPADQPAAPRPTDVFVPKTVAPVPSQPVADHILQKQPLRPQPPLENAQPPVVNTNTTDIQTLIARANANPRDAAAALNVGDAMRAAGDRAKAAEWYRKALQLDAIYKSGIDRMAVYDRLGTVQ